MSGVGVRAALLGPLEVTRDGRRSEPTSPKQRALLIDLLIHRGEALGRDRLIDDLWGDDPPTTAPGVLQNYVSQLRRALGAEAVRTVGSGYAAGDDIIVDVDELETCLERARAARDAGDIDAVREATSAALALWHGDPLADVAYEQFAQSEVHRLAELRGLAVELQLEAEVAAGRHASAVASLESAVAADPLRERLWWLLMLALYRSGRQRDPSPSCWMTCTGSMRRRWHCCIMWCATWRGPTWRSWPPHEAPSSTTTAPAGGRWKRSAATAPCTSLPSAR